ncbi:MAG: DUF5666 domain-containing protein [Pseudomonadota bacterium]|nr:DUF5666 domain-containing protein [Pseudomonadota bacterium]
MHRSILLAILSTFMAGAAFAQPGPVRLRGTIQALDGDMLTIQTRDGDAQGITLAPGYTVSAIVPSTLDAVRPGAMIGIVGFGPPKQQRAAVVSIFPPGATVNAAQFPWDSQPDSVMTNAPVTAEVAASAGRMLTVTIAGEPIEVSVTPTTIVQASEPGTPSLLVPGAHVLVAATRAADGALSASRVNVGKDGFTPAN